jgi:hypothetical protein
MEAPLDAEHKHYMLLAFLKETYRNFDQRKLFPSFSELMDHYQTANRILSEHHAFEDEMPKRIKSLDPTRMKIEFEKTPPLSPSVKTILDILNKSIKTLKNPIQTGQHLFDEVEQSIRIEPVGLLPMNVSEGYMLIPALEQKNVNIFQYQVSIIREPNESFRIMHTTGIGAHRFSLGNYPEKIKEKLLNERPELPNPAVFWFECSANYPFDSTTFPVSKRRFMMELKRFDSLNNRL